MSSAPARDAAHALDVEDAGALQAAPTRHAYLTSLTLTLAWTDFKLRYSGSALGYFWSFAKPLALFGVLYFAFTEIMNIGAGIEQYPIMMLLAIVLWTFFAELTRTCMTVLVVQGETLRKVSFPRLALPVSISLTSLLILALNLVAVFVFIIGSGNTPSLSWLWFPLLLVELYVFAIGAGLLLSVTFVNTRDVGQIWDLGLQLLFYATPIVYPLVIVPEQYQRVLMMLPLGQVVQQSREVLIGPEAGVTTDVLPGLLILVPIGLALATFVTGVIAFRRMAPSLAEHV